MEEEFRERTFLKKRLGVDDKELDKMFGRFFIKTADSTKKKVGFGYVECDVTYKETDEEWETPAKGVITVRHKIPAVEVDFIETWSFHLT